MGFLTHSAIQGLWEQRHNTFTKTPGSCKVDLVKGSEIFVSDPRSYQLMFTS